MNELIAAVRSTNMLRWYDTEINFLVEEHCPDRLDLIVKFKRLGIWYKDEILEILEAA